MNLIGQLIKAIMCFFEPSDDILQRCRDKEILLLQSQLLPLKNTIKSQWWTDRIPGWAVAPSQFCKITTKYIKLLCFIITNL